MTAKVRKTESVAERRELWRLAAGFAIGGGVIHFAFGASGLPLVLLILSFIAFAGAAAFDRIGHDVHLVFSLSSLVIGRSVSWLALALMYLVGIACLGSILRSLGMNQLERDFDRCRAKPTMLVDPPETTAQSFRRQS